MLFLNRMFIFTTLTLFVIHSPTLLAKPKCEKYWLKVKHIQSKLRYGYSAKQGEKLKQQERKARKIWWQCKNNIAPKKGKNKAK